MQSFGDLFANNRLLAIGVVLAAIAVILAVGIALFKLVFGRRLHMSGGRTRQPRLGVVDAFDLDRQRQLVLIRRDNVEHLLMIGGPNDVLVEAAIVRAPVAVAGRDKDNGFSPSVGIPAPMPQAAAALPQPAVAFPAAVSAAPEGGSTVSVPAPLAPEPRFTAAPEPQRAASVVEPGPAPVAMPSASPSEARLPNAGLPPSGPRPAPASPRPGTAIPPRPPVTPVSRPAVAPTPRTNLPRATPAAVQAPSPSTEARQPGRVEPVAARVSAETPANVERATTEPGREPALPARFPPARPIRAEEPPPSAATPDANRSNAAVAPSGVEDPSVTPPARSNAVPRAPVASLSRGLPPRPAPAPQPTPARAPLPSLGSLEEEMAKLLGRPMPPSDSSGSGS